VNTPATPYAYLVGAQDPFDLLSTSPKRIADLVRGFDERKWTATYAPGKWTAAQIVLHLAQGEIGFGSRVRLALTEDDYVIQPYDGGRWVELESPVEPYAALGAFLALRRLNLTLYEQVPAARRARPIRHPERGDISIDWIVRTLAGHDLHHLRHLQAIAG